MKFFGLRPIDQAGRRRASGDSTLIPDRGTPQGLREVFGFGTNMEPFETDFETGILATQYQARVDEIFVLIKSRIADPEGKIKVDKVTVKLGVDAGGKVGWFVEGRLDISLAFEVEFKVSELSESIPLQKLAPPAEQGTMTES
jgi:hypothetical protein